jgi:hypothetical protein
MAHGRHIKDDDMTKQKRGDAIVKGKVMRLFQCLLLLTLIFIGSFCGTSHPAYARGLMMMGGGVAAATTDAEIITYFNCDSATNGQNLTKGDGTVTISANWSANAGTVGNALTVTANGWRTFAIADANIDQSVGTLGFYWSSSGITQSAPVFAIGTYGDNKFELYATTTTELRWSFGWGDQRFTVANDTTYFIEVAWDNTNAHTAYRINGASWTEGASSTSAPAGNIAFGNIDSGNMAQTFDQVMISNIYRKDLYSVRTSTNP